MGQFRAIGFLVAICVLGSGQVLAQREAAARVSRPSEHGPSSSLGITGGSNTRFFNPIRSQSQLRFDYQTANAGGFSRGFGLGGGRGSPQLYSGPAVNAFRRTARRSGGAIYGAYTSGFGMGDVLSASGLEEATNPDLPLVGWESPRISSGGIAVYVAPSDATVFHNFFGLTPTREAPPPPADGAEPLQSELIGRINDRDINDLMENGKREFGLGTTIGRPDRGERLARAGDYFSSARRLDPKSWVSALLVASVALEQDRVETAVQALDEAVRRNARAIAERPDITALYGSREQFDSTARKFYQIGTTASGESKTVLVEAYLSLLAGDKSRAAAALRRSEEANRMTGDDLLDRISRAMRLALQ